ACNEQTQDVSGGKMLIRWQLPGDISDTIKTDQAEFRAQPEIPVRRLNNLDNLAFGKAIADLPRRVRVLADIQRRIQPKRTRARQQDANQQKARCGNASSSSVRAPHDGQHLIIISPDTVFLPLRKLSSTPPGPDFSPISAKL